MKQYDAIFAPLAIGVVGYKSTFRVLCGSI